jgi:glycosyltransferase involved in cell wall biosynthesis
MGLTTGAADRRGPIRGGSRPATSEARHEIQTPVFFSIVSANYIAYAQTLMHSVRGHHPGAPRYVFVVDADPGAHGLDPGLFNVVPASELPVPHFEHMALRYSILEFNTSLKPFAIQWLAARYPSQPIIYLDPDILVLAPLVDVLEATSAGALAVVTPHLTTPLTDDKHPNELAIMQAGAFNLGFIAIGAHPSRDDLVRWWARKLEFGALVDIASGLFTDQKWVNLVPGLFPDVAILRHPGYNLAYWNLRQRGVTLGKDGSLLANGQRVSFVHFSGIDPGNPNLFSKHQDRYDAKSIGDLRGLYREYLRLLRHNGWARFAKVPYQFDRLRDGTVITPDMRAVFRERFDIGAPQECDDPFALTASDLRGVVVVRLPQPEISRLWYQRLRDRPIGRVIEYRLLPRGSRARRIVKRFVLRTPEPFEMVVVGGADQHWYLKLRRHRTLRSIEYRLLPRGSRSRRIVKRFVMRTPEPFEMVVVGGADQLPEASPDLTPRIGAECRARANVIGYLTGEFGVAESARLIVRAAQARSIDVALINVEACETSRGADFRLVDGITDTAPHPVNILCVNADQTEHVMRVLGDRTFQGRYNVGYWFWELARFPSAWRGAIDLVDEIWVASRFVEECLRETTSKPVCRLPLPVDATPARTYHRSEFQLPDDRFIFLFTMDYHSFIARKNPMALVTAFKRAFPRGDESVALVLKTTNGHRRPEDVKRLEAAINGDPRFHLLDGFMSRDELFGLESVADCYVSLHRSEGFGLGLAESMSLGKPVIGTAYSGNMEFMDASNSCLVGYRLIDVGPDEYPYPDMQVWAEPDLDHAIYHMRRLAGDPAYAADLGRKARADIRARLNVDVMGQFIEREILAILGSPDEASSRSATAVDRAGTRARRAGGQLEYRRDGQQSGLD